MESLGKKLADQLAEEICSVQPMPSNLFSELKDIAYSRKELQEQGFKPVSRLGLLWQKPHDKVE